MDPLVFIYFQGANISQLERDIGSEQFPANEHYFGLVNVSTKLLYLLATSYFNLVGTYNDWTSS